MNRTFIVKFKPPELTLLTVAAERAEIQGDHLALLDSQGGLAGLFLMEVVESWSEIDAITS
jgi:hypothetical protein